MSATSEQVIETFTESMQAANEQGLTLTEYDETVRPSPEETIA